MLIIDDNNNLIAETRASLDIALGDRAERKSVYASSNRRRSSNFKGHSDRQNLAWDIVMQMEQIGITYYRSRDDMFRDVYKNLTKTRCVVFLDYFRRYRDVPQNQYRLEYIMQSLIALRDS